MDTNNQLRHYAVEFAQHAHARKAEMDRKIAELEAERTMLQSQSDAVGDIPKRLREYPVKIGADYICPRCWVAHGVTEPLKPIPSNTDNDLFRCHRCDLDVEIEN
jgi:hypothetical protein